MTISTNDKIKEILTDKTILNNLTLINTYDNLTYNHCISVAEYVTDIGIELKLPNSELKILIESALLHDIGKIYIDNKIINKPNKLTKKEYEIVKQHTKFGYEILSKDKNIDKSISENILYHHENVDGLGYYKLKNIPLFARIIHIADVYDALTSERPYRKSLTKNNAIKYMIENSETMFDSKLLKIFIETL